MKIDVDTTLRLLYLYRERFPQDESLVAELVDNVRSGGAAFFGRSHEDGHITCGAIVVDEQRRVLLVHHTSLSKWLTPGGHVEAGDTSLESAARRELAEETGIEDAVALVADIPVHIDRHTIPSNPSKGEGEHDHWDVRFLFTCPSSDVSIQLDEVSGFQWREISLLPSALAARVAECMKP